MYFYEEGLVRFATEKYSLTMETLEEKFIHLTNFSVNKEHENFVFNDQADGDEGSKWSFKQLRLKFKQ
jgi:tubulin polyglutamylase TTLL4